MTRFRPRTLSVTAFTGMVEVPEPASCFVQRDLCLHLETTGLITHVYNICFSGTSCRTSSRLLFFFILNTSKDVHTSLIKNKIKLKKKSRTLYFFKREGKENKTEYFDRYARRIFNIANSCTIFSIVRTPNWRNICSFSNKDLFS